jgi:7-cyano-7-deazaguanine synthase in queuosine biosynthesis
MERINILWTGGFDSTFVVCQLSLLPVEVQPIYISMGRKSEPQELKAMARISDYINANPKKRCKLLPVNVIKEGDLEENKEVSESYRTIYKEFEIGYQQDRIARLASQMGIKLVQGIEDVPNGSGHVSGSLRKYATMRDGYISLEGGEKISFRELDPAKSSREITDIFGGIWFLLPMYYKTKVETLELFKEIGYQEVVPLTWFCAQPINGKECGLCNPCDSVVKADMSFRLSRRARFLHSLFKKNKLGNYVFVKLRSKQARYR